MKALAIGLVMLALVCPAYAAQEDETVLQLVNQAVDTFKAKGKDQTLKLIGASAGPLRKGSIYVFALDFKGKFLAHPVQEDLRGQDGWEVQDVKGKFIIQDFIKIAKEQGQGWTEYSWLRVNENTPTQKKTYVKRVPGEDILVGAGYYVPK
jgi:signal transduction histidine kinase